MIAREVARSLAAIALGSVLLILTTACSKQAAQSAEFSENSTQVDPAQLATTCHELTSHPADKGRFAAGVSDEAVAPGRAIPACELAVASNPDNPTLLFELGRAYWLGGRNADAVLKFADAADKGHAGAMKYIGDAYLEGRGLPDGVQANIQTAADWYKKSSDAGFEIASQAFAEAEEQIRKNRFDPALFQNGGFMEILYSGKFEDAEAPLALAYYTQGLVASLDSTDALYMDQACKAMIGRLGSQIVNVSELAGIIAQYSKKDDDPVMASAKILTQLATEKYWKDQGSRDATVLFNKDVLGCDSDVTRSVIEHIMLTSNGKRAF